MKYYPNIVPLSLRVTLFVCAVGLLIYMCVGLSTGYTYIPGKRGGILLSAMPTFFIVGSASALFLSAMLTIIDHYDKRPNELVYKAAKRVLLKLALYLFIAAPLVGLAKDLLQLFGINIFPDLHGFAENYTLYSSDMNDYERYFDVILDNGWVVFLISVLAGFVGIIFIKRGSNKNRFSGALVAFSMLGMSSLFLANSIQDFLSGKIKFRHNIVYADQEVAKFNAILLTDFSLSGVMFTASVFVLVGVITGRIRF